MPGFLLKQFFGINIAWLLAIPVLVAGAYALGNHNGHVDERNEMLAQGYKQAQKIERKYDKVVGKIERQHVQTVEKIVYRTKTLKEQVNVYVPAEADAACVVPNGFVRVYNGAVAQAELPAAPSRHDAAPSETALSTVLATDVENIGVIHQLTAEVEAWRDWYPKVKAVYDKELDTR